MCIRDSSISLPTPIPDASKIVIERNGVIQNKHITLAGGNVTFNNFNFENDEEITVYYLN